MNRVGRESNGRGRRKSVRGIGISEGTRFCIETTVLRPVGKESVNVSDGVLNAEVARIAGGAIKGDVVG